MLTFVALPNADWGDSEVQMVEAVSRERSFSTRLCDFQNMVECRRIDDDDGREAVFRLRYDAYLREGAISETPARIFADAFDESSNAWILGIFIEGELASSIRIHVATPANFDVPGMGVFSDILMPEISRGMTIIDPTRFVADHRLARLYPELPFSTTRLAFVAAEHFDADIALATVRAEHQAFYKRTFRFQPMCPPRDYPSLKKPISLMSIHFPTFRNTVLANYPFLQSTASERAALFGRGMASRQVLPVERQPARMFTAAA